MTRRKMEGGRESGEGGEVTSQRRRRRGAKEKKEKQEREVTSHRRRRGKRKLAGRASSYQLSFASSPIYLSTKYFQ